MIARCLGAWLVLGLLWPAATLAQTRLAAGDTAVALPQGGATVALRAARPLPRGHHIGPGDLTAPGAVARLGGLRLTRGLARGEALRTGDLAPPLVIRRQGRVVLDWRHGALTLTDRGRALADAALGEVVPVLNLSSRRTVEGIAIGPGRVRVGTR